MQVLAIAVSVATAVGFIWLLMTCPGPVEDEYDDDWYDDDWYDDEPWEDDEEGWNIQLKLSRLFRHPNAVLSNVTESRVVDMDSPITLLDPDTSQFETLLSRMARVSGPTRIEWMEDELFPRLTIWWLGDYAVEWDWSEAPAFA